MTLKEILIISWLWFGASNFSGSVQTFLLHFTIPNIFYSLYILQYYLHFQHAYAIKTAANFLEDKLEEGISDNYTLALVTYALSWAKSTRAKEALNMLNQRAEHQGTAQVSCTVAQIDFCEI